jgi:hypothetical protein
VARYILSYVIVVVMHVVMWGATQSCCGGSSLYIKNGKLIITVERLPWEGRSWEIQTLRFGKKELLVKLGTVKLNEA